MLRVFRFSRSCEDGGRAGDELGTLCLQLVKSLSIATHDDSIQLSLCLFSTSLSTRDFKKLGRAPQLPPKTMPLPMQACIALMR